MIDIMNPQQHKKAARQLIKMYMQNNDDGRAHLHDLMTPKHKIPDEPIPDNWADGALPWDDSMTRAATPAEAVAKLPAAVAP